MKKVILITMPFFLIISLGIFLLIPTAGHIPNGSTYPFIKGVMQTFDEFEGSINFFRTLAIPNIPMISQVGTNQGDILNVLIGLVNMLSNFVNGLIAIFNSLISLFGILWQVIVFVLSIVSVCYQYIDWAIRQIALPNL